MNTILTLADLEAAINHWRSRSPSIGEELALCKQASALAEPYAEMIVARAREMPVSELKPAAREALEQWHKDIGHD